ncbi:unnamed protein product [Sphagnum troendelagicum]
MAPPSRASSYYCELCDRTLVPSANLEEHKVEAIHRGLMEASGKMTRCQLQLFREDLKVGRRKQKLPAKRAILEALRKPKGIDILDVVKDVVGLGCETT